MSANQPTSFRFPFNLDDKDIHKTVAAAIRYAFSGLKDLNDGIKALNTKVDSNTAGVQTVTQTITQVVSGGGSTPSFPSFGFVNLQPNLTPDAYTLAQSDLAGLILVNDANPFALTLNSGLTVPFFCTVYNFGAGTITATPSLNNVNNGASVSITSGQFAIIYLDNTLNWWAIIR